MWRACCLGRSSATSAAPRHRGPLRPRQRLRPPPRRGLLRPRRRRELASASAATRAASASAATRASSASAATRAASASSAAAASAATRAASATAAASAATRIRSASASASAATRAASAAASCCGEPGYLCLFGQTGFFRLGFRLEPGGLRLGRGCRFRGFGFCLAAGGFRLGGRGGLRLAPGLGGFEFGARGGLRLLSSCFRLRGRFGFRADLCGFGFRGRCGFRLPPGLGGFEFGASLGLGLEPRGLGPRCLVGFCLPPAFGGQERGSRRELQLTPGFGRFRLGLGPASGFGGFCCCEGNRLGLEPGGFFRRGGFRFGLQPRGFRSRGRFRFRLQPGSLGRGGLLGLRLDPGSFLGLRLDPGSFLGLRLDPGRLGRLGLGRGRGFDLCLDPGRLGLLGLGERRGLSLRSGFDLGPQARLDIGLDGVDRPGRASHAKPGEARHDVDLPGVVGRTGVDAGCRRSVILGGDVGGRPGQRVQRRDILATVLNGGVAVRVGDHRAAGVIEIGEGCGEHVLAEERSARQAATLGRVPAVAARVLPARHAEVEGLVERVELLRRDFAIGLVARRGERLVHGRVVRHDEVLESARHDPDPLEAGDPRNRGLERVAGAATFAE